MLLINPPPAQPPSVMLPNSKHTKHKTTITQPFNLINTFNPINLFNLINQINLISPINSFNPRNSIKIHGTNYI